MNLKNRIEHIKFKMTFRKKLKKEVTKHFMADTIDGTVKLLHDLMQDALKKCNAKLNIYDGTDLKLEMEGK